MAGREVLQNLPSISLLLTHAQVQRVLNKYGKEPVVLALRKAVDSVRHEMSGKEQGGGREELTEKILAAFHLFIKRLSRFSPRRLVNGTGIVIHTNLGRAPLPREAVDHVNEIASAYSSLEYDLARGERGDRNRETEELLKEICGCEAALVVNNNAAAILLVLSSLSKGKETVVSRGELVEIGGSFRIPDIVEESGTTLVEVGTTNKTRSSDYRRALSERTSLFMKVHRSNFSMDGFVEEVTLEELSALGKSHGIPLLYDMGSGSLFDLSSRGFRGDRGVKNALQEGTDLVTFSGDKLLGGPQAGIIVGRADYLEQMKTHPLLRAVRIDKMNLAALNGVLHLYLDEHLAETRIPVLKMLFVSSEELKKRAKRVLRRLRAIEGTSFSAELVKERGKCGGGALPGVTLETWCIAFSSRELSAGDIAKRYRLAAIPVIGRIGGDRFLIDFRTISPGEEKDVLASSREVFSEKVD